jgi:type II secretory pathway pseudopilin PulG
VLTTILLLGIFSGVAVQDWSVVERRDREAQLIFIQEQFAAAIDRYQTGQGALPTTLEQLQEKGQKGEYYLRKPYTDPMVRGSKFEDWCLLKVGGGGQVASSCAEQTGLEGSEEGLSGLEDGSPSRTGEGRSRSSFNPDFDRNMRQPGRLGQEAPANRNQQQGIPGVAAGTSGIVGVHSKSGETAYNTVKRGEDAYNLWEYTVEDYKKEASMRNLPGLPQKSGPGLSKPGTQPNLPGTGAGFSSGSGSSGRKTNTSGR